MLLVLLWLHTAEAAGDPTVAAADGGRWQAPAPGRLEYEVRGSAKGLRYRADATLQWQLDGQRYRATLTLSAFLAGSRVQRSTGVLASHGLHPDRFEDQTRRLSWLAFDWPVAQDTERTGRVRSSDGVQIDAVPPLTQDRLSVFMQLGGWMAAAQRGQRWQIPVAGRKRLEYWMFEVVDQQPVVVPAGTFEALHLRRLRADERSMGVELWYSPALPGLPVRILLQQADGDRVDQQLRAWRPASTPPLKTGVSARYE